MFLYVIEVCEIQEHDFRASTHTFQRDINTKYIILKGEKAQMTVLQC